MMRIITAGMSPSIQKTMFYRILELGEVNRSTGYRLDASGKAYNSARMLNQLAPGIAVNVSPLGEENAALFLSLAEHDSVPVSHLTVPGSVRSCYTLLEPSSGRTTELVVDEPATPADYSALAEQFLYLCENELAGADALLVAGSRPPFWPEDLYPRLCKLARQKGTLTMADFRGKDLLMVLSTAVPSIIKINEAEFCETFACPYPLNEARLELQITERSREFSTIFVVTRGTKDTLAAQDGTLFRSPVAPVSVLNTIGCGDAFASGFLYSFVKTRSVEQALELGTSCAAKNALSYRPGSIISEKEPHERQ
ncbi:MAG TPA: hypothetical protein GXZ47_05765 [Treponema sp.]|nr:hypothetical protein [Treponema sp.]